MHLLSPFHDVKAFICPGQECRQLFVNLSGLVAYVESGRCEEDLWEGGRTAYWETARISWVEVVV